MVYSVMITEDTIREKYQLLEKHLNEKTKRIWAATEAVSLSYGGISLVSRATQISRFTIHKGLNEIKANKILSGERIRHVGGGRKTAVYHQPKLVEELENLVDPVTRGDPESPLRWTCKSTRRLSTELIKTGFKVSSRIVRLLLTKLGYSLQGNKKTIEGKQHPDRNAQFEYINAQVTKEIKASQPVISVDTKNKELIGNYINKGKNWHKKGNPPEVNGHDFPEPKISRAHPYGIYELKRNQGFVNVGTDHDTATFAVASIRAWWRKEGKKAYPKARRLLITADAGGSNGHRLRLWKWELQRFANEIKLPISVCHFPPGTSKWNKVEHRLFSFISSNWRGTPLNDYATVVNLISSTTTVKGLKVSCRLDKNKYPIGKKITPAEWKSIKLKRNVFHGDWNYTIKPG